jgi:hypothetical protein
MVTGQTEFGAAVLKREPESITTRIPGGLKLPAISGFYSRRSQIQNHRSAFPIEPEPEPSSRFVGFESKHP